VNAAQQIDFIIVGQGLAGSALAMQCCSRRYKILVLDDPSQNRSSFVAAGLFNPVTGKKMVKTWLADQLFPTLLEYYRAVEKETGTAFLHTAPIYRPFVSIREQNEWTARSGEDDYRDFVESVSLFPAFDGKINDPFGGVALKQTGYLDAPCYLKAVRKFLQARGVFREQIFNDDSLEISDDFVRYGDVLARKIIFCQGVQNGSNRWFGDFPIIPVKGEFIHIQCDWKADVILNRGVFMMPGPRDGEWKVGATYSWDDPCLEVTASARGELSRKLEDLIRIPYTITDQQWGIRPTTSDRRPMLGPHPLYKNLVIFNGLGTKGVSLAPYFSEILVRWMVNEGMIGKEADVSRFI
jgi:glycine/D-amino acid oxidase-like deaminating enzyme